MTHFLENIIVDTNRALESREQTVRETTDADDEGYFFFLVIPMLISNLVTRQRHSLTLMAPLQSHGGHRTTLTWKKKSILDINFMIFLAVKKYVTTLNFVRPNIIKLWTKFSNKLGCKLRIQLHLIFFLLDMNFDKSTI